MSRRCFSARPTRGAATSSPATGLLPFATTTSDASGPMPATSMCCAGDSRARTCLRQGRALALLASVAVSGASSRASFARFDPSSSSWRTSPRSPLAVSERFSGTFPKRGTMLSGSLFEHTMSERLIFESDSSSWRGTAHWPTPDASMGTGGRTGSRGASPTGRRPDGRKVQVTLNAAVARTDKGPISPDWVEVLMGFPSGWTSSTTDGPQTSAKPSTRGSRRASAATRAAVKAG